MLTSTTTPGVDNDEWNQAAGKAREAVTAVGEMAGHAAAAAGAVTNQAACEVGRKADDLVARAGAGIQSVSDRLRQQAPQTGTLGSASQAVARKIHEGGEYIEQAKLSGLAEDTAQLIRRNPLAAVIIAIGVGWFVGRRLGR